MAEYREQVRNTLRQLSQQALEFQDGIVSRSDCVDRQEVNLELERRALLRVAEARGFAQDALDYRAGRDVKWVPQKEGFDFKQIVRTLAEEGGLYPADIAMVVIDRAVAAGECALDDESTKEIIYTEAENYAERYFAENGYEF